MYGERFSKKLTWKVALAAALCLILILLIYPGYPGFGSTSQGKYLPLLLKEWPPASPTVGPGRLLISEVLYHPGGVEPGGEWIEVFNAGGLPYDLSGCKLGDEETRGGMEGMLRFPGGVTLAPGQAIVIANQAAVFEANYGRLPDFEMRESDPAVPAMAKYTDWGRGNVELVNTGDEVILLDRNDQLLDALSWGNSKFAFDPSVKNVSAGHSLERYPAYFDSNSATDWREQSQPEPFHVDIRTPTPTATATLKPSHTPTNTPTALPTRTMTPTRTATPTQTQTPTPTLTKAPGPTPEFRSLLVSEVLYDPVIDEPGGEWIEIYNSGEVTIDLSNYKIGDSADRNPYEGMYQFPAGASIAPGQVIVIAIQANCFTNTYGFYPDYEMTGSDPLVDNLTPYIEWSTGSVFLGNTGDEVLLLDGEDNLVDSLSWGSSSWAFEPPILIVAEGHSLERRPANEDHDSAMDWYDQAVPNPGFVE